jgi:hypothetical protein
MKKFNFVVLQILLICVLSNGQSLGWSYENILSEVKIDNKYGSYEVIDGGEDYSIIAYSTEDANYYTRFYFLKSDPTKICGMISMKVPPIALNGIVTNLNQKYVKLSETKWKDYVSGVIFELLEKPEREFFIVTSFF